MERLATDLMILTPPTVSSTLPPNGWVAFLKRWQRLRPDPKLTGELAEMEAEKDHSPLNELVVGMALLGFVAAFMGGCRCLRLA
jgi:hypothetical protein